MKMPSVIMPYCAAVVPAAGSSSRMNGVDKIFYRLGGDPVIVRTLRVLSACEYIGEIVLLVREDSVTRAAALMNAYGLDKVTYVLAGGAERIDSVAAGVAVVSKKAKYIIVHDGARPLVTSDIVDRAVLAAKKFGAAACAVPVKDTVKLAEKGIVKDTPDRSSLFAVQTPQVFDADLLRAAITNAQEKELAVTDDCMAVEAIGGTVLLSEGSYENIKLTTKTDLKFAEAVLEQRREK